MSLLDILPAHAAPHGEGRIDRIMTALRNAQAARAQRAIYRQTVRELRMLSDLQLADLGINRATIEDVALKAVHSA